jgi:hypothetical protein
MAAAQAELLRPSRAKGLGTSCFRNLVLGIIRTSGKNFTCLPAVYNFKPAEQQRTGCVDLCPAIKMAGNS